MKLECSKCHYKFEKDKIPPRCPYCAAEKTITKVKTAQELLDEVTGEMDNLQDLGIKR